MKTVLLFAVVLSTLPYAGLARFATLTIGSNKISDEFVVGTNEVAQIKTTTASSSFYFEVFRSDGAYRLDWPMFSPTHTEYRPNPVIAGPARLVFRAYNPDLTRYFATIEITPESFPPDKTVVIPEGGGANIALECSTNLIDWTTAPLGAYTNQPAVKFFRLRAERLP